jgi:septum formation protein
MVLFKYIEYLNSIKLVLGTSSAPRRKIFTDLGINFEVIASNFEENLEKTDPQTYVTNTCLKKFEEIIENNKEKNFDLLITCDTIVVYNNKILEKPQTEEEIFKWFRDYSNNYVTCFTSVVIGLIRKNTENLNSVKDKIQFLTESKVYFDEMDDDLIQNYIDTKEPFNKAGGFGVQGMGSVLIKRIEGCYYNIVGFPVNNFFKNLKILIDRQ